MNNYNSVSFTTQAVFNIYETVKHIMNTTVRHENHFYK
jgi:hypothetical protein